ncbi:alpha-phosphoglucomutase [Lachnospiraceae bacterium XBB1006]|nr:alpha-phosphoglucomutase [Lachnospiraceae bacterium XBB1006]
MDALQNYKKWCEEPYFDEETKAELRKIASDEKEITERFYRELEFGTAGLRGILGAGTNRMNAYTVRKATQGLANYIRKQKGEERGVCIAYDSRHMSPEFADEAALCLAANGIKAYVFESLRPTPELSYAVRLKKAIAGINITASHNPSNYNGYKVYWEDGAQITPPHDKGIMDEVKAISDYGTLRTMDKETAISKGLYEVMGEEVDQTYLAELKKQILHPEVIKAMGKEISIVYTPLNGTGNVPVRRMLSELGFENVYVVKEQELPDGDFPTVDYPNPESPKAFELALKLAKEKKADLVLATDPDADRLGVYVWDAKGKEYHALTGNMSGSLLAEYILREKTALGQFPEDAVVIRSIVSTHLVDAVAKGYGATLIEVLTGFKYIGQKILQFEEQGGGTYLFGMEESYGCLAGTYARDKDAVVATTLLCEAAAFYKQQGKTLWDACLEMYERYGYYEDGVESVTLAGMEGLQKIAAIMDNLHGETKSSIGKFKVLVQKDYQKGESVNVATGATETLTLPKSNVLYYELENDAWVCVRPSGTEPKIKLYYGVKAGSFAEAKTLSEELKNASKTLIS